MLKSLFGYVNNFAERTTGLRLQPSADTRLDSSRKEILEKYSTTLVIDVGANRGQWVKRLRNIDYPGKVISFEPSHAFQDLMSNASEDSLWEVRNLALGNFEGTMDLYVSSNSQLSSSLLPPNQITNHRPDISFGISEPVPVSTLDRQLESNEEAFYLKIDTQGSEMDVLRGAENVLNQCIAIEFESAIKPMYTGETLHYELANWLVKKGFVAKQIVITDWDLNLNTLALDSIFVRANS